MMNKQEKDALEDKGIVLLEKGKLRQAEQVFKKLLADDARSVAAHFHLALVYRRMEKYEVALYHGRRVLQINPREKNACLNLGLVHEMMGNIRQAKYFYKKELARNPGSRETVFNLGRLYFKRRRWRQASGYLKRCVDNSYPWQLEDTAHKLGVCYARMNDLKGFIEVHTSVVQMFPEAGWAFANLGCALLAAKDYEGAALRFRRAKQLGTKNDFTAEFERAKKLALKARYRREPSS